MQSLSLDLPIQTLSAPSITLGSSERLRALPPSGERPGGPAGSAAPWWTLDFINGLAKLLEAQASFVEASAAGRRSARTCEFLLQCCIGKKYKKNHV